MKFIKLHEDAILPVRATEHSAGYDFCALKSVHIPAGEVAIVPTGISFEDMDTDQYLQLSLRSGVSLKRPFIMANGYGLIDSDYAGKEIGIILYNRSWKTPALVDAGERLAQAVLLNYNTTTDETKPTKKRTGGYGSTNK